MGIRVKLRGKFYVGGAGILNETVQKPPYAHETLEAAIEDAKGKVLKDGEPRPVVQIVRVVRKEPPPMVVEEVE